MIKPSLFPVIVVFAMTVITLPSSSYAKGFFEAFFGSEEDEVKPKGPPPEVTLKAPFPTEAPKNVKKSSLMEIYEGDVNSQDTLSDLSLPHRNEKQIVEWTTEIVSQAMTVNPKSYEADFKKIAPVFTPFALKEYNDYMTKTNMVNILQSNSLKLQAMSDEEGSIIKAGDISGTYHWLIHIPIMISYYKENIQDVDKMATITNQHILVQVQVGRIAQKNGADVGLVIERWSVSSNAKK
jgi:Type-IV b secretion system, inner-membrane complex component